MAYAYLCKDPHPRKYQAKTLDTLLADNGSHYDVSWCFYAQWKQQVGYSSNYSPDKDFTFRGLDTLGVQQVGITPKGQQP